MWAERAENLAFQAIDRRAVHQGAPASNHQVGTTRHEYESQGTNIGADYAKRNTRTRASLDHTKAGGSRLRGNVDATPGAMSVELGGKRFGHSRRAQSSSTTRFEREKLRAHPESNSTSARH
ncbi:hypothetical protein FRC08_018201 [Ceratobasidium sp. 394]|nr:hypothetical protein FRC08_018201 [Ceratobasidium sp. 394]